MILRALPVEDTVPTRASATRGMVKEAGVVVADLDIEGYLQHF
jgi:hypothetical protein